MEGKQLAFKAEQYSTFIFIVCLLVILFIGNPALSIFLGILFSLIISPKKTFFSIKVGTLPLQAGIIFLGATISLPYAWSVGSDYFLWISLFVIFTFFLGIFLGKFFGVHHRITFLLSAGAAICGATAIAAVAPIIKAKPQEVLISITIIFLLNALAIILFPIVGNILNMNNYQFGAWSALSIHDTSSVMGAALSYSDESAQVAATLKLGRTLWIIPLLLISAGFFNSESKKINFPKFIIFFLLAILMNTFLDFDDNLILTLKNISQYLLLIGLFCIGTQSNITDLKKLNIRPIILATCLWLVVIPLSYIIIIY
ncbi:putative sulfate exporter family transporter [bacterium]|nr:putative sulfate exporter family transporter [bacterium]